MSNLSDEFASENRDETDILRPHELQDCVRINFAKVRSKLKELETEKDKCDTPAKNNDDVSESSRERFLGQQLVHQTCLTVINISIFVQNDCIVEFSTFCLNLLAANRLRFTRNYFIRDIMSFFEA